MPLQDFVKSGGRSASPQFKESKKGVDRRAVASHAKIKPSRAPSVNPPVQHQQNQQRQRLDYESQAPVSHGNRSQQYPRGGLGQGVKRDQYDTDADSSLDTTMHSQNLNDLNNQLFGQGHYVNTVDEDQENENENDDGEVEAEVERGGEEEEEESGTENEHFVPDKEMLRHTMATMPRDAQEQVLKLIGQAQNPGTLEGDSYPTTTSGRPEDELSDGQEPSFDFEDQVELHHMPTSHSQHQDVNRNAQGIIQPDFYDRPVSAPGPVREMNSSKFHEKGASIRKRERSTLVGPTLAGNPNRVLIYGPENPPITHAPTHMNNQPTEYAEIPSRELGRGQNSRIQNSAPLTGYGLATTPNPLPQQGKPAQQIATMDIRVRQQQQEHQTLPMQDYDNQTLFKKTYDQLQTENFDFDPRAPPSVLPPNLQREPLPTRLTHARTKLAPETQAQFFSSLSTAEWEESGDWFLEQFTGVVQKMREARQQKRKLALEFEGEIEMRNLHVAKRHAQVEESMGKMKNKGQTFLPPKTPRKA